MVKNPTEYLVGIEAWRVEKDYQMRAPGPGGWLAIVGMYPLRMGVNIVGSAEHSDVLLPVGSAPSQIGTVDYLDKCWILRVTTNETVTVDQKPVRFAMLRTYGDIGGMSVVQVREVRFGIQQWASDPINIRVWDANNPKRINFPGRFWYPIDLRYRVKGKLKRYALARELTVEHTGGQTQELHNIGVIEFELMGTSFVFEACEYVKGDGNVWLLMRDGTSGRLTYGAGRFLNVSVADDNSLDLDFNKLYHPPCAFFDFTTCPMPPRGNFIPFSVEAGEHYPQPVVV